MLTGIICQLTSMRDRSVVTSEQVLAWWSPYNAMSNVRQLERQRTFQMIKSGEVGQNVRLFATAPALIYKNAVIVVLHTMSTVASIQKYVLGLQNKIHIHSGVQDNGKRGKMHDTEQEATNNKLTQQTNLLY